MARLISTLSMRFSYSRDIVVSDSEPLCCGIIFIHNMINKKFYFLRHIILFINLFLFLVGGAFNLILLS